MSYTKVNGFGEDVAKAVQKTGDLSRKAVSAVGAITKQAMIVCKESFSDMKAIYSKEKAEIDQSLIVSPGIYDGAMAMMYTLLQAPPTFFSKIFGTIPGAIFGFFFKTVWAGPYYLMLSVLDLRTLKNFFATIFYFVKNCLPLAINNIIKGVFEGLANIFNAISKGIQGQKKLESLKSRQMLEESKFALMEGKIWDWVKGALYKVFEKIKSAVLWLLKKGLGAIEAPFMKFVYPIATCMSQNNKMTSSLGQAAGTSLANATPYAAKLLSMFGLGTSFAGLVVPLAYFLTAMGMASFAFMVSGYLSGAGQIIEMKNLVMDAFSMPSKEGEVSKA